MQKRDAIKHCRECGHAVTYRIPDDGDTRERAVCPACATVHYVNPLNVVGTLPYLGDKVLLCKRAIEPRAGFWTLPAGFMELGETLGEGAMRETDEEAGAHITLGPLFTVISVPQVGQVHSFFLAELTSEQLNPGPETLEARLFPLSDIPWDEIAFPTVSRTLRLYIDERQRGQFGVHCFDVRYTPRKPAADGSAQATGHTAASTTANTAPTSPPTPPSAPGTPAP